MKSLKMEIYYESLFCTDVAYEMIGDEPIATFDGKYHITVPFDYLVYRIDKDGIIPEYILPVSGKRLKKKKISTIRDFSIFTSSKLKGRGYDVGYNSILETSRFIVLAYYNLEYLLIDKTNLTSILFSPEDIYSETCISSFYYLKDSVNDTLVSVDVQRFLFSDELKLIFYHLKK